MAISLTRLQVAEKAWRLANPGMSEGETKLTIADISAFIDEAVKEVCDKIYASDQWYYLQTSFGVTLSSGQAALPSNVFAESIMDSKGGRVTHTSYTRPLVYAANLADLYYPQAGGSAIAMYHVVGGNSSGGVIYARTGVPADLTGVLTILACAYQTFDTLSPELENDLVEMVADMAKAKMSGATTASLRQ